MVVASAAAPALAIAAAVVLVAPGPYVVVGSETFIKSRSGM